MDYSALIQFRKSVRAFQDKAVPDAVKQELAAYFREGCKRLLPELKTELRFFEKDTQSVLEGAAGYQEFLIGAPCYLVSCPRRRSMPGKTPATWARIWC